MAADLSLADSAGALVAFLSLAEAESTATISSSTQLLRPIRSDSVRAVALPLHRGRTTVTVQTSIYHAADRLVAQMTQVQAIRAPS